MLPISVPAFITNAPPMVPGMPMVDSSPLNSSAAANCTTRASLAPAPAMSISPMAADLREIRRQAQHGAANPLIGNQEITAVADDDGGTAGLREQSQAHLQIGFIPRGKKQVSGAADTEGGMASHRLVAQHLAVHVRGQLSRQFVPEWHSQMTRPLMFTIVVTTATSLCLPLRFSWRSNACATRSTSPAPMVMNDIAIPQRHHAIRLSPRWRRLRQ